MKIKAHIASKTSLTVGIQDKEGKVIFVPRSALQIHDEYIEIENDLFERLKKAGYKFEKFKEKREKGKKEKEGGEG